MDWLAATSTWPINTPLLFETSQLLSQLTAEPVQSNKAIVGRNAFAHEAGIHQDGMLKDSRTYEIMRPVDVGQHANQLVLGHLGLATANGAFALGWNHFIPRDERAETFVARVSADGAVAGDRCVQSTPSHTQVSPSVPCASCTLRSFVFSRSTAPR